MKSFPFVMVIGVSLAGMSIASAQEPSAPPAQIEPKAPAGVDVKLTSNDPDYGYSKDKPVRVGSKGANGGPGAERQYLSLLRDEAGSPVDYRRLGSVGAGPDGNILDLYEVLTSTGRKLKIHIDMYHPDRDPVKEAAPKGLYKAK